MKEFGFYLDAYHFCKTAGIPITNISRRDFRTWMVKMHELKVNVK
jgi:hypothetical protein